MSAPAFLVHSGNPGATQTKILPFVNGHEKVLFSSASEETMTPRDTQLQNKHALS